MGCKAIATTVLFLCPWLNMHVQLEQNHLIWHQAITLSVASGTWQWWTIVSLRRSRARYRKYALSIKLNSTSMLLLSIRCCNTSPLHNSCSCSHPCRHKHLVFELTSYSKTQRFISYTIWVTQMKMYFSINRLTLINWLSNLTNIQWLRGSQGRYGIPHYRWAQNVEPKDWTIDTKCLIWQPFCFIYIFFSIYFLLNDVFCMLTLKIKIIIYNNNIR